MQKTIDNWVSRSGVYTSISNRYARMFYLKMKNIYKLVNFYENICIFNEREYCRTGGY